MRIEIDLPDWVDERHIRIFTGIEEVAHKYWKEDWKVKKVRCDLCGKCCMNVIKDWVHGRNKKTGYCSKLRYDEGWKGWLCDFGVTRPFSCCAGDFADKDFCCVEWE